MNANKQDAGGLPELPESKYLARLSKDGEWAELIHSNDWTAEMWAHGTEDVYSGDQMRAYGEQCRAASGDAVFVQALLDLIGNYWDLAYKEGAEGRQSDTQDGAAQWTWNEIERRIRTLSRGVPEGRAVDDGLPEVLMPHADEWYRLCERRFYADRISISGELAEAIVHAVCNTTPPEVGGGRERDGDA